MNKKKKNSKKAKRIVVTLSSRDYEKLSEIARRDKATRPIIAKRLIRNQLATITIEKQQKAVANQLGLFDSVQIDILGGTSKVN
ncbi:MAG: hypothetical protein K6A67_05530 [Bacteroidales bacterium]|nr:hypothetical protein [Bacteroidales bacterium]